MKVLTRPCVVAMTLCLMSACLARADTVFLKNGDRLTGVVSMKTPGALVVSTEYAGDITVDPSHVAGIETEAPVAVERNDGAVSEGVFQFSGEQQRFGGGETWKSLDWTEVHRFAGDAKILAEAARKADKAWSGAVDSGVTFRSGEKDTFDAILDVEFTREKTSNTLTLRIHSAYGESDTQLDTQRIKGLAKWQFYPDERFYYFGVLGGEHDKLRRLELRTTTGAGVGYDFIKNERQRLSADVGAEFVYERWGNYAIGKYRAAVAAARANAFDGLQVLASGLADGSRPLTVGTLLNGASLLRELRSPDLTAKILTNEYVTARLSVRYARTLFKDSKIEDEMEVFPNLDSLGEFRLTNKLSFWTPFSDTLSLRVQLRTEYESDPGSNVDKFDNILALGVRWEY